MSGKRALVLSGGSIKGCFQAGAIAELLESGFVPDAIYGTSVGSLNGGFLTERAGRLARAGGTVNWPSIGQQLERFWLEELKSPGQVGKQRSIPSLLVALLRNRFAGLIDMSPLRDLVYAQFDPENLRAAPVEFYACAVNLANGEAVYASRGFSGILDYIIASTAIPVEMPHVTIVNAPYVDGGVRDIAPLGRAIEAGADEIAVICCLPEKLDGVTFRPGNLMEFALRLMDVISNELINNDLEQAEKVNQWVGAFREVSGRLESALSTTEASLAAPAMTEELLSELPQSEWRQVDITVIRPESEIALDLMNFTPDDIAEVMKQGRNTARTVLSR